MSRCSPQHEWQHCHHTDVPLPVSLQLPQETCRPTRSARPRPAPLLQEWSWRPRQRCPPSRQRRLRARGKCVWWRTGTYLPSSALACSVKCWSFLAMLWNALWRICLYLKMQSRNAHLLMLCVGLWNLEWSVRTRSVRCVNLVVAVRRKALGEILVWLQIYSYKH